MAVFGWVKKTLKGWFCGPDNETPEAGRFIWFASAVAAIGYSGWHLYLNGEFDVMNFGAAMSAILLGGFGISAKDKGSKEARP